MVLKDSVDEVLLNETTLSSDIIETDAQLSDDRMVFHCRPELSTRSVLFQGRNSNGGQRQPVPVQLLTMDGRSLLGLSVPSNTSNDVPMLPRQDDDKLPRILVTTKSLSDPSSEIRLRRLQLMIAIAAVGNLLLTAALLYPASTDAWYHVDAYRSWNGEQDIERVRAVRLILLVTSILSNGFLVSATYFRMDALLSVYISILAVLDIWSLVSLLPHGLFFTRFLFDVLLVGITLEVRTHLEQTWFLTSFHRLRA